MEGKDAQKCRWTPPETGFFLDASFYERRFDNLGHNRIPQPLQFYRKPPMK